MRVSRLDISSRYAYKSGLINSFLDLFGLWRKERIEDEVISGFLVTDNIEIYGISGEVNFIIQFTKDKIMLNNRTVSVRFFGGSFSIFYPSITATGLLNKIHRSSQGLPQKIYYNFWEDNSRINYVDVGETVDFSVIPENAQKNLGKIINREISSFRLRYRAFFGCISQIGFPAETSEFREMKKYYDFYEFCKKEGFKMEKLEHETFAEFLKANLTERDMAHLVEGSFT